MLVLVVETRDLRWAGRRHDDDRPCAGTSQAGLFDAVFAALHDGEQVALGLDCPLTASGPGIAVLDQLLAELGTWRPWSTVSTSLARWRANTSILVWEAPAGVEASQAAGRFFRQLETAPEAAGSEAVGQVVNLAAAAARRAGLSVDKAELATPTDVLLSVSYL